jgi:signal transduction histidine kinase
VRLARRIDVGIVLMVAALGQLDVWGPRFAGAHIAGPRAAVSAAYLVTALALLWRRAHPLRVGMIIGVVDVLQWLAFGASSGNGTLLPVLAALSSAGLYCDLRPGFIAVPAGALVLLVHELTNPNLPSGRAVARAAAWDLGLLGLWLLGAYLRTRRLYVAELRERAARTEREHEERAKAAVLEERAHIARELHDAIAHGVSVMVVQAEAAEEVLGVDPAAARGALRKVQQSGRDALVEMRRLVGLLRTDDGWPELAPSPGLSGLEALIERVREAGQPVQLQLEGTPLPLAEGVDRTAYRIIQEALTNVLKHAGAAHAFVRVAYQPNALMLEISDDGNGPTATNGAGHGLAGMRERVGLYGGEFHASGARDGFRVRAALPLSRR